MNIDSSFSFDIYPDVDAELAAAYQRNVASGDASPEEVAQGALSAVVAQGLENSRPLAGEIPKNLYDRFMGALEATQDIYAASAILVPDYRDAQFESVNWQRLSDVYEGMRSQDLQPEIVVSRRGISEADWKSIYARLPNAQNGGLYINENVSRDWSTIDPPEEQDWSVSVVSATETPLIVNVSHNLAKAGADEKTALEGVYLGETSPNDNATIRDSYPTLNEYLTLQALHLRTGVKRVDAETATWLHGTFDNGSKAPCGYWYSDDGRVRVRWDETDYQLDYLGVRPAVRE